MKIIGIEGMTVDEVHNEIERGGKFVLYQYCVSVILLTFQRSSDIYFIRQGEGSIARGLGYTGLSLLLGWWGIPWGPIFTIAALITNFSGGKVVTQEVMEGMR